MKYVLPVLLTIGCVVLDHLFLAEMERGNHAADRQQDGEDVFHRFSPFRFVIHDLFIISVYGIEGCLSTILRKMKATL